MCSGIEKYSGIFTPASDAKKPNKIDNISGFLESFFATISSPFLSDVSPSLYNSKIVMDVETPTMEIDDDAKAARGSPPFGNANMTNGMPKNARLPKTVLKIRR
jgi:hypothetical protein